MHTYNAWPELSCRYLIGVSFAVYLPLYESHGCIKMPISVISSAISLSFLFFIFLRIQDIYGPRVYMSKWPPCVITVVLVNVIAKVVKAAQRHVGLDTSDSKMGNQDTKMDNWDATISDRGGQHGLITYLTRSPKNDRQKSFVINI